MMKTCWIAIMTSVVTVSAPRLITAQEQAGESLAHHLAGTTELAVPATASVDSFIRRGAEAERAHRFAEAAAAFARASVSISNFAQRDSLQTRVRNAVQSEMREKRVLSDSAVDALTTHLLDQAFSATYDTLTVTKATPAQTGRTVLAEYITGTQCGACWGHDRVYSALLRRYANTNFIVLAYHDGYGYPIANARDSLWGDIASNGRPGLYELKTGFGLGDLGWVDGAAVTTQQIELPTKGFTRLYDLLSTAIDEHLQTPPEAEVTMTLTPVGGRKNSPDQVKVNVRVTPNVSAKDLVVRIVLVQDTVRVTGATNRRLQYAAVRAVAWFGNPRKIVDPIPGDHATPSEVNYTFDLAALQRALFEQPESDAEAREAFPNPDDWRLNPARLGVVVIVQDRVTRHVLQTTYQRILQ